MNTFRLFDDVSPQCVTNFAKFLDTVKDGESVRLEIMSYGGEVFSGLAIAEKLAQARTRGITSHSMIYGIAASAAAIIAISADRVTMTDAGSLMLHGVFCRDCDEQDDGIERANQACLSIINRRAPNFTLKDLLSGDSWFDARAALELGLIDEIRPLDENTQTNATLTNLLRGVLQAHVHATNGGLKMDKDSILKNKSVLLNAEDEQDKDAQAPDEEKLENAEGEENASDPSVALVDGINAVLDKLAVIEQKLDALMPVTVEVEPDDVPQGADIMAAKLRTMYDKIGKVSAPCAKKTLDDKDELKNAAQRIKKIYPNIAKFYEE